MAEQSNPFATRFTRPGALPYQFPKGNSAHQMVDRLLSVHHGWGQIVGPHGSGKSTLLHVLIGELQNCGKHLWQRTLHAGERRLTLPASETDLWSANTQVIIDGYEQLNWCSRWRLSRACRRRRAGLLVTTHRPLGLPTLFETQTSVELLTQVVNQLTHSHANPIPATTLAELYSRHQGNLREVLFALYDYHAAPRGIDIRPVREK